MSFGQLLCPSVSGRIGYVNSPIEKDWARLGEFVRAQRGTRTQQEVAALAGIGTTMLGEIERVERTNYTQRSLTKLAKALWGSDNSIERILEGKDPLEAAEEVSYSEEDVATEEEVLTELGEIRSGLNRTLRRLETMVRQRGEKPA